MMVRTRPAAVSRYSVTAPPLLLGAVRTISPTGCSAGKGTCRIGTVSKATSQRRSQSGAAAERAGHDTRTVGMNAASNPAPRATSSSPLNAVLPIPLEVKWSPAIAAQSSRTHAPERANDGRRVRPARRSGHRRWTPRRCRASARLRVSGSRHHIRAAPPSVCLDAGSLVTLATGCPAAKEALVAISTICHRV